MPVLPADRPRPLDALSARVDAAAQPLPRAKRTALVLREREGAGYADVATALAAPAATAPPAATTAPEPTATAPPPDPTPEGDPGC